MTLCGLLTPRGELQPQDSQRGNPQSLGPGHGEELCPLWVGVASPVCSSPHRFLLLTASQLWCAYLLGLGSNCAHAASEGSGRKPAPVGVGAARGRVLGGSGRLVQS